MCQSAARAAAWAWTFYYTGLNLVCSPWALTRRSHPALASAHAGRRNRRARTKQCPCLPAAGHMTAAAPSRGFNCYKPSQGPAAAGTGAAHSTHQPSCTAADARSTANQHGARNLDPWQSKQSPGFRRSPVASSSSPRYVLECSPCSNFSNRFVTGVI